MPARSSRQTPYNPVSSAAARIGSVLRAAHWRTLHMSHRRLMKCFRRWISLRISPFSFRSAATGTRRPGGITSSRRSILSWNGNGRVGRLLVILLLCDWGLLPQPLLYLSAYFDANRRSTTTACSESVNAGIGMVGSISSCQASVHNRWTR